MVNHGRNFHNFDGFGLFPLSDKGSVHDQVVSFKAYVPSIRAEADKIAVFAFVLPASCFLICFPEMLFFPAVHASRVVRAKQKKQRLSTKITPNYFKTIIAYFGVGHSFNHEDLYLNGTEEILIHIFLVAYA